jgi:hypothetical protein
MAARAPRARAASGHDQPVKSLPRRMSALRPVADTLNRIVRSLSAPPERRFSKPAPLLVSCNPLNDLAFNIRTKMAVVRLRRRKSVERDEKRPEVGLSRGPGSSDNSPGMAAFCGIPTANQGRKKNVPHGETGGGSGIRILSSTKPRPQPIGRGDPANLCTIAVWRMRCWRAGAVTPWPPAPAARAPKLRRERPLFQLKKWCDGTSRPGPREQP